MLTPRTSLLLHRAHGTALTPAYDIVPGLFARDMIDEGFKMAFAVNCTFDQRRMSVDALAAEAQSPFYPDRGPALAQRIDAESLTKWRPGAAIGSENDS